MSSASDSDRHREMTEKRQAAYVKKQAKATKEKGLLIVITGTGKGKTTSALGMGLRALGHQMKLGVVQFLKGSKDAAERRLFEQFDNVDWFNIGDGYTCQLHKLSARERFYSINSGIFSMKRCVA